MSMTETIPDTQDQESSGATQALTAPEPDPATDMAQEAIADLPADFTTDKHAVEGVKKGAATTKVGSLTFTSDQTALTPEQRAALSSLNIDPDDPVARAHWRRFMHVCQLWNVDPWSGEIHLVQRGTIWDDGTDKRSWTIQTGIDGYRRRAREISANPDSPVRWIGKAKWFWSYGDDDPDGRGWTQVRDEDTGDMVMEPVWYSAWPDNREPPALAKAVIITEDKATGERRVEQFTANWRMFAVYEQVWQGRKKVLNDDGSPKMKLGSFWAKGPQHMLAKCAEAQALRAIFHGHFHGVYTNEEMNRADADNAHDLEEAAARRRRDAFRQAQLDAEQVVEETGAAGEAANVIRAAALAAAQDVVAKPKVLTGTIEPDTPDPIPLADALAQTLALPEPRRLELLHAEIDWITRLLGANVRNALTRRVRRNLDKLTADELLDLVGPMRATTVIPHLRAADRNDEADAYASFGPRFVGSVEVLTGHADPQQDLTQPPTEPAGGSMQQPHDHHDADADTHLPD